LERPVILEGPDGAGKSTLAASLARSLNREVFHSGGPPVNKLILEDKLDEVEQKFDTHVIDRVPHISEPIYSRVSVRRSFIPEFQLHDRLKRFDPIVVYCRLPQMSDMFKAIDRSKKPHKPSQHLEEVLKQYRAVVQDYDITMDLLSKSGVTVIMYAWTQMPVHKLVERLTCAG